MRRSGPAEGRNRPTFVNANLADVEVDPPSRPNLPTPPHATQSSPVQGDQRRPLTLSLLLPPARRSRGPACHSSRSCHWLHHDQADADTETDAHTLNAHASSDNRKIVRAPAANCFIPDEPEYHSGGGLGVSDQRDLRAVVDALECNRAALRRWDPNHRHMIQTVFNLVPLSSCIDYLPGIDSFQVARYPRVAQQAYFGHKGNRDPLMRASSMAHGVAAMQVHPHVRNPSPCMQGVGLEHTESDQLGL